MHLLQQPPQTSLRVAPLHFWQLLDFELTRGFKIIRLQGTSPYFCRLSSRRLKIAPSGNLSTSKWCRMQQSMPSKWPWIPPLPSMLHEWVRCVTATLQRELWDRLDGHAGETQTKIRGHEPHWGNPGSEMKNTDHVQHQVKNR